MDTVDPNQAQNLPEIEKQIAVSCVEHAQTYWNLLEKVRGSKLRLTKCVAALFRLTQARRRDPGGVPEGLPGAV